MKIKIEKTANVVDILTQNFPEMTATNIKKILKQGAISHQNEIIKNPKTIINQGDFIEYTKYSEKKLKVKTAESQLPFKIMFEDDDIIVVVKPAGILTIGGSGESRLSMLDMVKSYLKTKSDRKDKAFAVHRLDREVSGLLLIAKNEKTKAKFITNWKDSHKLYRALVHGKMTTASGTLKDYITEGAKQKMVVVDTPKNDKNDKIQLAVLSYEVIKEIDEYTLLNINIQTGRKNQIRVQMSNAGHPIVGDRRYGDTDKFERQIRLQAYHLEFKHPSTKENLSFEIAMPKHFLEIRNMDENYKQQINKNYRKK